MAFGYPGDATPDTASLKGTGAFSFDDPERGGSPMVPLKDAALKEEDAKEIYHVQPGESFVNPEDGKTYRYADIIPPWSPAKPGYVDVFDPNHAPDVSVHGQLKSSPRLLPEKAEHYDPAPPLADSPEPEAEKPPEETPVETIQKNYPEYANLSYQKLLPKLESVFPDVPKEKLNVWANQPGGGKMIRQYQDRNLSPLERFRKHYGQYATGDDDKDLEWMRSHFQPDMGPMQFKAFADPPNQVLTWLGHLYDQMTSAAVGATVSAGRGLANPIQTKQMTPLGTGILQGAESSYAAFDLLPKAAVDAMANLQKTAGVYGWTKAASDWMSKNVAGYGGANNWFKNFVNGLTERSKQFEAQSQQLGASIPKDTGSQIAGTVGQVIGQTPDMAVSFGLGSVGRSAALWGMMYEGTSAYGHAIEYHQKNALLQGVTSAGFRQFAQYLFNTGKGRLVSGIMNSFATVADAEIEKWARGEPNDISKDGKAATVGLLMGLMLGRRTPQEAFMEAEPPKPGVIPPDVEPQSLFSYAGGESILRNPDASARQVTIDQPGKRFEDFLRPAIQEEIIKAEQAHHNGDHDAAAEYIDRGFSLTPDEHKRELAQKFIDKVDDLAADSKKKTLTKEDELFNDYYFSGLPYKPGRHNKFAKEGEQSDEYALPPDYFKENPEGEKRYRDMPPEDQLRYRKHLASQDGRFYSGIPFSGTAKAIKDWFESNRPGLPIAGRTFSPEYESEGAERAGQIIKSEEARSRAAASVIPSQIYRHALKATGQKDPALNTFEKITGFRFGDPLERMDRFFHNFSKAELIQQFIDYQDGNPIKDPTARWMWKNVIGPTYDAIEKRDQQYGVEYDHRENYFYQLLTHPKNDLPKLKQSMARSGIGLTFTKPREMRLVERLALGHEMVTINPVRLMQLRWWSSDRAIQKIRDMRQLEAQGLAFNTTLKGKNIPPARKGWVDPSNIFATPDKQSYYVDPAIIPVLNNKFDPSDLFRTAGGPVFKFVASLKGAVAAKVSWSLFHPLHIMDITQADVATNSLERILAGKGNWSDVGNLVLNEIPFVGSLPAGTRAYLKYADATNYLKGRLDFDQLTPDQQRDTKDFIDMGLVVDTSQERQMQFTKWLQENGPSWIRKGGWPVKVFFDVIGNPLGFNKWWFGTVTPRLKFASAMMRRDTLQLTRPDLFRSLNRMDRLKEFQAFHRDVEGRYGEMHYDNLLWPRMAKQTGTTFMLSLGWQLGMFRTMGDGVIDLTRNTAHMQEILKGWATRDPAARHLITNRMVFSAMYLARGLAAGWAISYFLGGKKQPDMWDGVYPVVGKDAKGKEKRINMQYFYKDIPAWEEYERMTGSNIGAGTHMLMNKMNPMMMAVVQASLNRDYMNHVIGDLPARVMYVMSHGVEPISFENAQQPGQTDADKAMSFLGFSPSGRWTMRSDLENKIISQALEARSYGPLLDARDRYKQAFESKDQTAIKSAHDELIKMRVTEKQIHNLQKSADTPIGHKFFTQLLPAQQEQLWKEMSPTERKEYWRFLKPALKGRLNPNVGQ